jgi:hypothetical protein
MKTTTLPFLVLSLLTAGCGRSYNVPSEVQPLVDSFLSEAKNRNRSVDNPPHLVVSLDNADSGMICSCETGAFKTPTIHLPANYWHSLSPEKQMIVFFHEAGHCILSRDHNNEQVPWGIYTRPKSLMAPQALQTAEFFDDYKTDYLDELFNP